MNKPSTKGMKLKAISITFSGKPLDKYWENGYSVSCLFRLYGILFIFGYYK